MVGGCMGVPTNSINFKMKPPLKIETPIYSKMYPYQQMVLEKISNI